jgi:hypothetical protein
MNDATRDEGSAPGRRLEPSFRHELGQRRKDGIAMDAQAGREPAAARQPVSRAQASSLDVGGERARDLQERWQGRGAVDSDYEFPGGWHSARELYGGDELLVQVKVLMRT